MADKNKVYKKIVWKLNQTKEQLEAFQFGEDINSPMIEIMIGNNLTKWYLSFYPRGECEEYKDGVGLFLNLAEADSKEFHTKFTLGVVGTKGNKERNLEKPGNSLGWGYGNSAFMKQADLSNLDRGYFTDGNLTLYCKLTLSDGVNERNEQALSQKSVFQDVLKRMLAEELFADFEVRTSDKKALKAHKGVLGARSPYFYAMLTSGMKGAVTNVVKVPEDFVVMKAVLSFIYSGEVENLKAIAHKLVYAAQKYQLDELKELCIESFIKKVSCKHAVKMMLAAEGLADSDKLKEKCIDVIASNFEFLSTTDEWEKLPPGLLTKIILHVVSEIDDTIIV